MAGSNIAQVIIRAVDQASSTLKTIGIAGKKLADDMKDQFESISKLGGQFTKLGAIGMGAFGLTMKAASEFGAATREAMSMTGLAGEELTKTTKKAKELASTLAIELGVDSTEVMKSFYYVLSTGAKVGEEGFRTLSESAIKLSKLAKMDLSQSVSDLADITKTFNKNLTESDDVLNVLFRSTQLGNTNLPQLTEALKESGKAGAAMGIDIETVSAMLVKLSNKADKGAEAGYALRTLLLNIANPTKAASEAFNQLGVKVYEGGYKARDTVSIMKEFKTVFNSMTTEKQTQLAKEWGVSLEYSAQKTKTYGEMLSELKDIMSDSNGITTKGKEILDKMGISLTDSSGSAKSLTQMMTELKDKLGRTNLAEQNKLFSEFGIKLYDSSQKTKKMSDVYKELSQKMESGGKLTADGSKAMQDLGINTVKSAGKMRPIIDILRDMQSGLKGLSQEEVNKALEAIGGTRGFTKLNTLLQGNIDELDKWVKDLKATKVAEDAFAETKKSLGAQFTILLETIKPVIYQIGEKLNKHLGNLIKNVTEIAGKIKEWVAQNPKLFEQIVNIAVAVSLALVSLGSFLMIVGGIGVALAGFIKNISVLITGISAIGTFLAANPIALWIAGIVASLGVLYLAWTENWGGMQDVINNFIKDIGLDKFINKFVETFMHIYDNVSPYITLIQEALGKIFNIVGGEGDIQSKIDKIKGIFGGLVSGLIPIFTNISSYFTDIWNKITASFNAFVEYFKPAWDGLYEYFLKLINELWLEIQPLITDIQKFVQDEWAKFNTDTLPQLQVFFDAVIQEWNALKPIILPIVNILLGSIMLAFKNNISGIISIMKIFWGAFKSGWDIFTWILNNLLIPGMTAIAMSITEIINNISESWKMVKDLWKKYIAEPWDYFLKILKQAKPTIVSAVETLLTSVWNTLKIYYLQIKAWFDSTFGELIGTLQSLQQMASGGASFNLTTTSGTSSGSSGTTSSSGSAKLTRSLSSASRSSSSSASSGSKTFIVNGNIYGGDAGLRELNRLLRQYGFEEDARGVI